MGKVGHDQRLHAHHGYQQSYPGHNIHPRNIHHPTDHFGQQSHNRQQRNPYPNHQYHHGPHHTGYQQGRPQPYVHHPYVQPGYQQQPQHQHLYDAHPRYQKQQEQLHRAIPITENPESTTFGDIVLSTTSQDDFEQSTTSYGDIVQNTNQIGMNLEQKDLPVEDKMSSFSPTKLFRELLPLYYGQFMEKFQHLKTTVELQVNIIFRVIM